MVPEIGVMIGCYIVTKLLYISGQEEASITVKVFSGITILVTLLVVADLALRGLSGVKQ